MESFSKDPIGFAAGDANQYRYVENGPTNATDPSGLKPPPKPADPNDFDTLEAWHKADRPFRDRLIFNTYALVDYDGPSRDSLEHAFKLRDAYVSTMFKAREKARLEEYLWRDAAGEFGSIQAMPGCVQDQINRRDAFNREIRSRTDLNWFEKAIGTFFLPSSVNPNPMNFDNAIVMMWAFSPQTLNPRRPTLPVDLRARPKTRGVLRTVHGDLGLVSGYNGPSRAMPKGTPGMNGRIKSHVEAHAAAFMRQHGCKEAVLYISRAPCGGSTGCEAMLPRMLPEGAILRIVMPGGADSVIIGRPD